jgi:hypothetical protein
MAVRSYLDQVIQNEAAARAAGAPVTRGSFTDIANREVGSGFVDRALGTIPANTAPLAPAYQQTFLSGLLAQLQSATPEQQQQVARFAPQIQGLLGPVLQDTDIGREELDMVLDEVTGQWSPRSGGYNPDYDPAFAANQFGTGWGPESTWSKTQNKQMGQYYRQRADAAANSPVKDIPFGVGGFVQNLLGMDWNPFSDKNQAEKYETRASGVSGSATTPEAIADALRINQAVPNLPVRVVPEDAQTFNQDRLDRLGIQPGDPGY